ncbi:PHD finger protein ALFIN-LIKE 2-like isoform X4 [Phalaenopsis equestris]|uniref:PHD finger protein ALFIN-LIKE 2-like isoform X4 n=1 Tax=Phalaenopsis equestris TaxID=78828 RepID=UPI0009E35CB2|nr:PHD finger protein ALFIN-LIKE 2-like isoform X4 [Phalaenopsis equestris]
MDGNYTPYNPRSVDEVFKDFKGRRAGLIKALTNDVDDFYQQCDPDKENLCLYGFPSEQWEVNLPAEEIPPEIPEPALGINFARDGMREEDWLSLVAVHSDAWLISVAFYFGSRFGFDRAESVHQNLRPLLTQGDYSNRKKRMKMWMKRRKKMSMRMPFVVHVGKIMALASSGYAAMSVRSGSMANVLRLHLQKLNTSSNTSALLVVATKDLALLEDRCCSIWCKGRRRRQRQNRGQLCTCLANGECHNQ